jgi:hypothetical protein
VFDYKKNGGIMFRMRIVAFAIGFLLAVLAPIAHAAETGTNPDSPPGNTLGLPTGTSLPPGFYVTLKPSYSQGPSVNGIGGYNGGHSEVAGATGILAYVPGGTIFGAHYSFFIRSLGVLDVSVTQPQKAGGKTFDRTGLLDTSFVPINLSWALGNHFFYDAEIGFYPPIGQYSRTAVVNVGQNHWTLEPNTSLSYLPPGYQFTVHTTFDKNFQNAYKHYINGTTMDIDMTAMKNFDRFSFGPVSYFYRQITADAGPAKLNGGTPVAFALGADGAYAGHGWKLNVSLTHDIYDRNVSDIAKVLVSLIVPF